MYVHSIPSLWNEFQVGDRGESAQSSLKREAASAERHDLRELRRQVLTLDQSMQDLLTALSADTATEQNSSAAAAVANSRNVAEPEASLREFGSALHSLFDDSHRLAKPGPILRVLRDSLRDSVTSVFNQRGPGFLPPFHFGFNFPAEPELFDVGERQTAEVIAAFYERREEFVEFMVGAPEEQLDGIIPGFRQALRTADQELSSLVGDVGILLDVVA